MEAIRGKNNIFQIGFKCKSCEKDKILNQIVEISLNHLESSELCMTINNEGRILFPILMHKPVVNLEVLI